MPHVDELDSTSKSLREEIPEAMTSLLVAILIWLFGVLVFFPLANTIDGSGLTTRTLALIITAVFSVLVFKAVMGSKCMVGIASSLLAVKYTRGRNLSYEESRTFFENVIYVIASLFLYVLYWSLLIAIHPALPGLALTLVLLWLLFPSVRILSILSPRISVWFEEGLKGKKEIRN